MRDIQSEVDTRVEFIKDILKQSGAKGVVLGNSGGKDSALVAVLCKRATDNVLGVIMPCGVKRNFEDDLTDASALADKFGVESMLVDLTDTKQSLLHSIKDFDVSDSASLNIAPRLRMTVLYALAQSKGYLVAGTGNASEIYTGYFTKWGDGAYDFNPIADLTATEVLDMLKFLDAPKSIIDKPPSAALAEGQTDESEMGITYSQLDTYLRTGKADKEVKEIIERYHKNSEHKRRDSVKFGVKNDKKG